ncbi:MAG: hypothetical protein F6K24_02550 [Okeania sp. SIO2D1]|nr:hypothetical protein [Okeania sp. SIO2D1]
MTFSKNWNSRKAVIAPYHIPILQDLARQTGIDSLSDAVNFLIAEYRKQQSNNTTSSDTPNTSITNDDFGLSDDLI